MENSSVDDCYFYYYSSCTKGSDCPFRHSEAALGTETVCTLWKEGSCYRSNCKFRHMESRINRASIPCYWENRPGGCRKPHCVFFHHMERPKMDGLNETGGLILPVASQPVSPAKPPDSSAENKWESSENLSLSPSSHAIQPVVVSLDEGEESDTESTASTPMKVNPNLEKKISSPSKTVNPAANGSSSETDLGIKTLEQIKMAKIHRESEHFYNPGKTDVASADTSSECARLETMYNEPNSYYSQEYSMPASEATPMELENESYQNASLYPTEMNNILHGCSKSPEPALGDLRDMLKKRKRRVPEKKRVATELSTKRIISLKKSPGAVEDESLALTVTVGKGDESERKELSQVVYAAKVQSRSEGDIGFRVKTLDEIRKEKEKRQSEKIAPFSAEEVPAEEEDNMNKSIEQFLGEIKQHSLENRTKSKGSKRKLRRRPLELYKSLQKQTSDFEASKESLEQDLSQMSEDIMSAEEAVAKDVSVEVIAGKKEREGLKSSNSVKRASSDVPVTTKSKKLTEMHRTASPKVTTSEIDGDKSSESVETNQKADISSLKFKRRNIMRKKIASVPHVSENVLVSEDSSSQLDNSELSNIKLVPEILEVSVSSGQNGTCSNSDDCSAEAKDVEMSNDEENANGLTPSPSVPVQCENRLTSLSAVDELDTLFLGSETDMCQLDEIDTNPDTKAEDLFLEFEQMLQS